MKELVRGHHHEDCVMCQYGECDGTWIDPKYPYNPKPRLIDRFEDWLFTKIPDTPVNRKIALVFDIAITIFWIVMVYAGAGIAVVQGFTWLINIRH